MRLSDSTRHVLLCLAAVLVFVAAGLTKILVPGAEAGSAPTITVAVEDPSR